MKNDEKKNRGGLKRPYADNRKMNYSGKCDVRLSASEDNALSDLAERNNVSRSDIMRRALRDFIKFNNGED